MAKKGNYQIPFDKNGNQQHYPESWYVGEWPKHTTEGPDWRDNAPFTDTLMYAGHRRGRSAAYFQFLRSDGTHVTMFLADFEQVVPHMMCGHVSGTFAFVKRGQNYGAYLIQAAA